jgi:hypothetical protein
MLAIAIGTMVCLECGGTGEVVEYEDEDKNEQGT